MPNRWDTEELISFPSCRISLVPHLKTAVLGPRVLFRWYRADAGETYKVANQLWKWRRIVCASACTHREKRHSHWIKKYSVPLRDKIWESWRAGL